MKKIVAGLVTVSILLSLPLIAEAVDLNGRVGIGYSAFSPLSGWSMRYWLSEALAVNGVIGFHFETDRNEFLLGGRIIYKAKDEKNLNLYLGGEIGVDLRQNRDDNFSIGPFAGAEYFFAGLPNLGFGAEIGAYYESADSTFATLFGGLSIHYYFGAREEVEKPKEIEKPKEKKEKPPTPTPTPKKK